MTQDCPLETKVRNVAGHQEPGSRTMDLKVVYDFASHLCALLCVYSSLSCPPSISLSITLSLFISLVNLFLSAPPVHPRRNQEKGTSSTAFGLILQLSRPLHPALRNTHLHTHTITWLHSQMTREET
jgi:hypothetical protein